MLQVLVYTLLTLLIVSITLNILLYREYKKVILFWKSSIDNQEKLLKDYQECFEKHLEISSIIQETKSENLLNILKNVYER